MLIIKSAQDLKSYLETRKQMVVNQIKEMKRLSSKSPHFEQGLVYAFEESIKAVEALLTQNSPDASVKSEVTATQ